MVILGDRKVGKSALSTIYTGHKSGNDSPITVKTKEIELYSKKITVEIYDPSSDPQYFTLVSSYFAKAHCFMLMFDLTNEESFTFLFFLLDSVRKKNPTCKRIMILGTKSDDKENRKISALKAANFASSNNLLYEETSTLDSNSVEIAFKQLIVQTITTR